MVDPPQPWYRRLCWLASRVEDIPEAETFVLVNLWHDGRIPPRFWEELSNEAKELANAPQSPDSSLRALSALQEAVKNHQQRSRLDPSGTFCDALWNECNWIASRPDLEFVTVFDVESLIRKSQSALDNDALALTPETTRELLDALASLGLGSSTSNSALREIVLAWDFSNLNLRKRILHLRSTASLYFLDQPCWVAIKDEFLTLADLGTPASWLEAVGLPSPGPLPTDGRLREKVLVILSYSSSELRHLLRPSQIDAGWFAFHFPTPPSRPIDQGGLTMRAGALGPRSAVADDSLVSEFVHRHAATYLATDLAIHPDTSAVANNRIAVSWIASGWARHTPALDATAPGQDLLTIRNWRKAHLQRLGFFAGSGTLDYWMKDACELPKNWILEDS